MDFKKKFSAADRPRTIRKALDFWYRNFSEHMTLKEFIAHCTEKFLESGCVITYSSAAPKK